MPFGPLLWRLVGSNALIVSAAVLAIVWYNGRTLGAYDDSRVTARLESHAQLALAALDAPVRERELDRVQSLCRRIGADTGTHVTVIGEDGRVLGDSSQDASAMESQVERPEFVAALNGESGHATRIDPATSERVSYVALPLLTETGVEAVVRVSSPQSLVDQAVARVNNRLAIGALLGAILAIGMSLYIAGRVSRPLKALRESADRVANGDLHHRLPPAVSPELVPLTATLNQMVNQLERHVAEANRDRDESEAILASMVEGVLAVDTHSRVITVNKAAAEMFGFSPPPRPGDPIAGPDANPELQRFVADTLASEEPILRELTLEERGNEIVRAQGTLLRGSQNEPIGAVVVLHDVTRLRRLEQVRRDFVANVSHELKTPITTIKGFVETLLENSLENPGEGERFMRIVSKHANRLNAIIEDLLALSRLEHSDRTESKPLAHGPVRPVLEAAMQLCAARAAEKTIPLSFECDPELSARINAPLLEQAIVNLIDNAIKYSEPHSGVDVAAMKENGNVRISVTDQGCGIAPEHLPRLFERFYRVDKAESRRQGGTGLGLSIVKDIAEAHAGKVSVQSTPGKGSTFILELPA
jgi:two-component system, OmpR family, phosphate regulon sensor histidine kinase PhoR